MSAWHSPIGRTSLAQMGGTMERIVISWSNHEQPLMASIMVLWIAGRYPRKACATMSRWSRRWRRVLQASHYCSDKASPQTITGACMTTRLISLLQSPWLHYVQWVYKLLSPLVCLHSAKFCLRGESECSAQARANCQESMHQISHRRMYPGRTATPGELPCLIKAAAAVQLRPVNWFTKRGFHGLTCAKSWRPNLGIRHQMALPVIMQEAAQVANRSAMPPSKSELTKCITRPVTTSEWFDRLRKQ